MVSLWCLADGLEPLPRRTDAVSRLQDCREDIRMRMLSLENRGPRPSVPNLTRAIERKPRQYACSIVGGSAAAHARPRACCFHQLAYE
jgi:hypothetical protein